MIQVALPEQVVEKVRDTAAQEGTDLSDMIERALDHYLAHSSPEEKARETSTTIPRWRKKRQQIEEEQRAYKEQHARILANHAGQYIAMVQGKIIDHEMAHN